MMQTIRMHSQHFGFLRSVGLVACLAVWGLFALPVAAFEIVFTTPGADEDLRDRLSAASLVFAAKAEDSTDGQDIVAAAQSDYKRLIGVLYEQGYFGPVVNITVNGQQAAAISPFAQINTVSQVTISVTPGKKFRFGVARIAPLAPETELPEGFVSKEPALLSVLRKAARAGVEGWRAQGHAKAAIKSQSITADHKRSQLDTEVALNPGPKLAFGALKYSGTSKVREDRVRKITGLPTGETFDPEKAKRAATRLRRTGTFRAVELREAQEPGPDDTLDMELTLVDDLQHRIGFGAELESRDGLSLSAYWLHRNLLGGAESLRFDASIDNLGSQSGGTDYRIGTLYTRPATLDAETDLVVGFEIKQEDEPLYFLRQVSTQVAFKRYHSERFESSIGLGFGYSQVDDNFGSRDFLIYGIPVRTKLDRRDNISNPTRGYYAEATAFPYLGSIDAENALFLKGDLRGYRGLGQNDQVILAGRLQLGSIVGPSLAATPPDLLFFSGGGDTVRGQPYQSNFVTVGGIDSGGLSFVGLSGEMRVKITSHISTVAFYDAGYVGETAGFGGAGNWHAGAGLGVRYNTGFGPLRVDLAAPVSGSTGGGYQLYIGIGHAF